ncbi:tumor protein D52, partial [Hyalella azteca]|uniref:Tumor protein D52 n=1 Tax=Hyalella azteca TaxID=294128 RepID=A0A979FHL7_HYAAZ
MDTKTVSAPEVSTPDSGVHENLTLSPEEQERQNKEWEAELAKTEEEISTLRTVLASKVNHAHELKRRLGITVWKELSDDINQSFKTVRESQPFQFLYGRLPALPASASFTADLVQAGRYQKTAGAIGAVGEKTSSLFGGIGAKFGQLKETPTFKSFEERVGGVYSAARSKIPGGSGSNSTQDFEEAFKEAEGEKAAAEAAANATAPAQDGVGGVDPSQQQQS